MDIVDESTLESLITWIDSPCVSLYMPTHRSGPETEADPIVFRNLLERAERELLDSGMRPRAVTDLLADSRRLLGDPIFWQHLEDGLALFASPKHTELFRVAAPLPQMVIVGDAFHVKPLWPVASKGERFGVLTLSRNRIRLLWGTRYRIGEIDLPDEIPESLAQALWFEDTEKQLQSHAGGRVGRGRVAATFHGGASLADRDDERVARFFRAVDEGVLHLIKRNRPLVLAGVDEAVALYRKVSRHPTILDDAFHGNADRATLDELHTRAWTIAEPYFARVDTADREAFLAAGARAVGTLPAAVTAALQGRVAVIFVPASTQVWGRAAISGEVEVHAAPERDDRDLLDLAAVAVWRNGGRVHVVDPAEIPGNTPVAALLRY
ncbi:MAG TPA: hypothetical protein VGC11_08200 [Acidimicrobiia bacterium]|jgi:hypothetical protein